MNNETNNSSLNLKHKHLFWISALLAGIAFNFLIIKQSLGVNFFIFVTIAVLAGLIPILLENVKIPRTSLLLLIPIAFFAFMTFIRVEPFTTLMNILLTLACLILFAVTLLNGKWHKFEFQDYITHIFHFLAISLAGGILFLTKSKKETPVPAIVEDETINVQKERPIKHAAPYIRGVLLAIPILALFATLLAQADPIFNDWIQNIFSRFTFSNMGEYLIRLLIILVVAYFLLSTVYFAYVESKKIHQTKEEKSLIKPFLGSIEANIILGGVNLLFLLFVILQFSYLFNGGKNISAAGYTYSEYARRGFFELILVAVISLVLFYVLSMVTKRENKSKRWVFSALGLTLVGLVAIILVSAYTRLTLYEIAYGFTRLRTLAHIFMIWIALVLIAVAGLEITKNLHRLAFILVCLIFGLGLTVNLLNIDRFIVQQNITRAINGVETDAESELDSGYLFLLSEDAVPTLVQYFTDDKTPSNVKDEIGGVLACNSAAMDETQEKGWPSYHISRNKARNLLESQSNNLEPYPVSYDMYTWFVEVNGEVRSCSGYQPELFD